MSSLVDAVALNAVVATALALLVGCIALLSRRPALLHCLWVVVLLKLVTPPIIPVSIPWPTIVAGPIHAVNEANVASQPITPQVAHEPVADGTVIVPDEWIVEIDPLIHTSVVPVSMLSAAPISSVRQVLWAAWILGSCIWIVRTGFNVWQFSRLLKRSRVAPPSMQRRVDELAAKIGLTSCPTLILVPGAVSPMIWALGTAPRLVFPQRLLERLDAEQQTALVLHELAHVLRRDHWVRVLELIVTGLFWWHPVVWWAKREIHEAEEQCCDAWVVWAMSGEGRSYALALVQTVEFCSQVRATLPAAASGIGPVPHLRRRLTMIMQGTTPRSLSWIGACAVLGLGAALPLAPIQAQSKPEKADEEVVVQDSRDQQIEVLKRALRVLEEQKDGNKPGKHPPPKADPVDIEKARKEIERREKDVNQKRHDLHEAEHRLHEARNRLRFAEGKPALPGEATQEKRIRLDLQPHMGGDAAPYRVIVSPRDGQPREVRELHLRPDGQPGEHKVIVVGPDGKPGEERRTIRMSPDAPQGGEQRIRVHTELAPAERRGGDVERRLERLLQEVEELRRELRRQPPRSENRPEGPRPQSPPPGTPRPRVTAPPAARAENLPPLPSVTPVPPVAPTLPTPPPVENVPPLSPPVEAPSPAPPPPAKTPTPEQDPDDPLIKK